MKSTAFTKAAICTFVAFLSVSVGAYAETATTALYVESVAQLNKRGKHIEAIAAFKKTEDSKRSLADKIAAAQSAWALGLVDMAREQWNEILANQDFKGTERTRTILALAMLELQERRYDKARALAEKALPELDKSDLKAQFLIVIGEALSEQGAHSKAEQYYREAAEIGNDVIRSEAKYFIGENQFALGRLEQARQSFSEVETASDYAPRALQRLVKIDLAQGKYDGVLTWIKEGREEFSLQFEDPWIRYAQIIALAETNQIEKATEELAAFKARYSDQDSWYTLASATYEAKQINVEVGRLENKNLDRTVPDTKDISNSNSRGIETLGQKVSKSSPAKTVKTVNVSRKAKSK